MAVIVFMGIDGKKYIAEVKSGVSLMEAAYRHSVPGIVAECGGACACATCHVYIEPDWLERLPQREAMEDAMLDMVVARRDNSRLSCQIIVNEMISGINVQVADNESV